MALLLTENDVATLLTVGECVEALEAAFRRLDAGEAMNQPRRRIRTPAGVLHQMEAADLGLGRIATKTYTTARAGARFLVQLYDAQDGRLLALIEANRLGQIRTGAATGVATRHMARPDAATLALIGSGWQAESQALAVCAVRPIRRILVCSRTPENRERFAEHLHTQLDVEALATDSADAAISGADVVVTATSSATPVLSGAMLRPGVHVNAVGSNSLTRAEIDVDAVRRAQVVAVDSREQARAEAGDLLGAIEARAVRWEQIADLSEVVAGRRPGRTDPEQITLFESLGLALEDLVAASLVYDHALERHAGEEMHALE